MPFAGREGPVLACLDAESDAVALAQSGIALALACDIPLYLVAPITVPMHRPLQPLSSPEMEAANGLLDIAHELAMEAEIAPVEEVWIARAWDDAIAQMADELAASVVVIGWRAAGPFGLFEVGRTLRRSLSCPLVTVGGASHPRVLMKWPPEWLTEARVRLSNIVLG